MEVEEGDRGSGEMDRKGRGYRLCPLARIPADAHGHDIFALLSPRQFEVQAGALRDGAVFVFVCLFVCSCVA